jgi:hypothetical protein
VGHKVKIHKITPGTGKERGDIEMKDYVVFQKPQEQVKGNLRTQGVQDGGPDPDGG